METLDELIRKIEDNLEEDWVKLKEIPKRCILKQAYDLVNVPGYIVELAHDDGSTDLLFIADIANAKSLHYGSSAFVTN